MTKAALLAGVDDGARALDALFTEIYGPDHRPRGNGTYGAPVTPAAVRALEDMAPLISSAVIDRRVYIAAPWALKWQARAWRTVLEQARFVVTSRWLDLDDDVDSGAEGAQTDIEDLVDADICLLINPPEWRNQGTGGRHVELGYAIATGKRVVVFGAKTNVFHELPSVEVYADVDALLAALETGGRP